MLSYDLKELIEISIADGFTVEGLGKATDVPVELINRYLSNDKLTQEDIRTLDYLLTFLAMLYIINPDCDTYFKDMVETMNSYYEIPIRTIANYLKLDERAFNNFLESPESFTNGYSISIKLTHLFIALIRDKRNEK